uniref:Uncharacterized protein n=1 Tax=Setaria italica TaxID=4555 RepID=K3Z279_SETIT
MLGRSACISPVDYLIWHVLHIQIEVTVVWPCAICRSICTAWMFEHTLVASNISSPCKLKWHNS